MEAAIGQMKRRSSSVVMDVDEEADVGVIFWRGMVVKC